MPDGDTADLRKQISDRASELGVPVGDFLLFVTLTRMGASVSLSHKGDNRSLKNKDVLPHNVKGHDAEKLSVFAGDVAQVMKSML